jgi:hypothetical protein
MSNIAEVENFKYQRNGVELLLITEGEYKQLYVVKEGYPRLVAEYITNQFNNVAINEISGPDVLLLLEKIIRSA